MSSNCDISKFACPVCRAQGRLYMGAVDFDSVIICCTCGSIFSEITLDKSDKPIKAVKIGEKKYHKSIPPVSVNEPITMEFDELYLEMLQEPIVYGVSAND